MTYDPSNPSLARGAAAARPVDAGLQAYMRDIYNTMVYGLAVTGAIAWAVASIPPLAHFFLGGPQALLFILVPFLFLLFGFTPGRVARQSAPQLRLTFVLFSAAMGLSMASVFFIFTGASLARVFFITAGTFAGASLYGYVTRRDLTALGSFLMMGTVGILLALVVNAFMHAPMLHFIISAAGVAVFTGMAAWDTQRFRAMYAAGAGEANAKAATLGALSLYMDFLNLFQFLLQFLGDRR